ncbi:MAG: hypothetical protein IPF51_03700 [Dehalococcoidia bacterium]|uniref:hypothetical protein n=1 Tax=Candidatus Amarobacter glycogenicus TaxID=3140699 RepID=UPI003135089E|nr:hypothetical protein [Dehalococcoidia bacterium]
MPNPPLLEMKMAMDGTLPTTKETFYRQDLGVPWVSEDARLTLDDLERCRGDLPFDQSILKCREVVMGVDVGTRLHVVVRGFFAGRWYLLEATTKSEFSELDELIKKHGVTRCVVDAQPERRAVRDFFQRNMAEVRLCLYVPSGLTAHWDWTDGIAWVRVQRTLAMDDWLHSFKSQLFAVPDNYREICGGEYVRQLLAPVRVTEPDAFGQPVATYKHTRPDDFAHAEVYATLATTQSSSSQLFYFDMQNHRLIHPNSPGHPDLVFKFPTH